MASKNYLAANDAIIEDKTKAFITYTRPTAKRIILFLINNLIFGIPTSFAYYLLSNPIPLNARWLWTYLNTKGSPLFQFILHNWPPSPLRWIVYMLWYRNSYKYKNHAVGINEHYSISNDFYKIFLDKKYMFYITTFICLSSELARF
jgi:hypothetical protein